MGVKTGGDVKVRWFLVYNRSTESVPLLQDQKIAPAGLED